MLTIRPEQLAAFSLNADRLLVADFAPYVRKEYSDREVHLATGTFQIGELPIELIKSMALVGLARARRWGLTWESNLFGYLALMFCFAPNFDEHHKVREILGGPKFAPAPNLRLDYLENYLTDDDWSDISGAYDASAWNGPASEAQR
jgi:hypothetical protein